MTSDRFGLEGIWDEKVLAADLHNRMDVIEASAELTVGSHVYNINTLKH